jgi:outer membrane protein assembly factor BamB
VSPLPEAAAGLEILNSIFVSKTLAFAIASDQIFQSYLIAFDPESGTVLHTLAVLTSSDGGYFADFAWDGSDKIFVADRSNNQPGIRIFSVTTFAEITSNPLDTGLPPYSLDIWRP